MGEMGRNFAAPIPPFPPALMIAGKHKWGFEARPMGMGYGGLGMGPPAPGLWVSLGGDTTMGRVEIRGGNTTRHEAARGRRRHAAGGSPLFRGHLRPGAPERAGPVR